MKIAFTTKGKTWDSEIDPRFGRTEYFVIYDEEKDELLVVNNQAIDKESHGAGPKTVQKLLGFKPDVLITGNGPGQKASLVLQGTDIEIYTGAGNMNVKKAYETYKNKELKKI